MAFLRGIAGCLAYAGRSDIVIIPAGHLALGGRANGRDVVADGMLWRTAGKSDRRAGRLVVP